MRAKIPSLRKYVSKKLSPAVDNVVLAAIKQSIDTTYVLAEDTGEVAAKNVKSCGGHWKLNEDTRRTS